MLSRTCLIRLKKFGNKFLDSKYLRFNICRRSCSTNFDYASIPNERTRNFSIIAHVDHGKSTLADRLLEFTGTIKANSGQNQILDKLQVEKERGITVKAQSASLLYDYKGEQYLLNLIDTPGHVDFSNEVARSLSACQGVVLLVDANDGVQAQTVANFNLAFLKDLVIVPVLNKIDLKNADPDRVCSQLKTLFEIESSDVLKISAKHGTGVNSVLEAIIERLPPPLGNRSAPLKALLYDSWFDRYRGVLSLVCVKDGQIKVGDSIKYFHGKKVYEVRTLSVLRPNEEKQDKLVAGQIGLIGCNMRSSKEAHIGDTVYHSNKDIEPLPGFKPAVPMVFAGLYPFDKTQHMHFKSAIEKLVLNDNAVSVELETSHALGQGWRLGFLGLLHLEVFSQRLQQEYGAESILTSPSVTYKVILKETKETLKHGRELFISNPEKFPSPVHIEEYYEPMVLGTIIAPDKYLGSIMSLIMDKRGEQKESKYIDNERVMMLVDLPLNEVVHDFHDSLKTLSSGYASFDYEDNGFKQSYLVKLEILLNGKPVPELSSIVHATKVDYIGRKLVKHLKGIIPREMIQIAIQAVVNKKVIARENLPAFRKDVTAKLYGGDVTRRMKLLAQQSAGKKAMRQITDISLSRKTLVNILKTKSFDK